MMTKKFKTWGSYIIVILIAGLSIGISIRFYNKNRFEKIVDKYSQIQTWQDAKDLFEHDLENNDLKYFFFGLLYNHDFDSIKEKHDLNVIFMGDVIDGKLSKYNYFIETQIIKDINWQFWYITSADSIWTKFLIAIETKQIDYLLSNSFDSIKCPDLERSNNKGLYESKYIFENHLDKLTHCENLSTQKAEIFSDDTTIQVNYSIDCTTTEEKELVLIYKFEKQDKKYLFKGMTII